MLKQNSIIESINYIDDFINELDLPKININEDDLSALVDSVNIERMSNNPIIFDKKELYKLYKLIK